METLRYETHVPDAATDGSTVLILLHGRGSHRKDLLTLADALPTDIVLVTPEAPHPGRAWGYGPGWAWYRYLGDDRVDPETLESSLEAVGGFLDRLAELVPTRPGPVVLGGFSQGGTTSLAYALRHPGRVTGVVNFSGFLADGALESAPDGAPTELSLFWGHGTRDPNIPHAWGEAGRTKLRRAGADVTSRDYSIGHWIAPEEVADAIAWMRTRVDG